MESNMQNIENSSEVSTIIKNILIRFNLKMKNVNKKMRP